MERLYDNGFEITGNISSISKKMKKANGKDFMFVSVAQNDGNGRASFYPHYLDGETLKKFEESGFKVGDRVKTIGKIESYQKDGKSTLQIRPFEIQDASLRKKKETTKETQTMEM